jgi:predicted ATPase/DNA-binding XRE family transcriptional regulator
LRLSAGLTQEELAERAQLSERAVRRLEAANATPRIHSARLLAEALDLTGEERARLIAAARPGPADGRGAGARTARSQVLTPLIGREEDLAVLKLLLEERRLVTVRGPGGVGKTRLALAVAEQVSETFDRVGIVELAPLRDPSDVLGAIAGALSIREHGSAPLLEVLTTALDAGRTLLLLDNMEHLLPAGQTVLDLLGACPGLVALVTSREALRVRGERVYTLAPLALPVRAEDIDRSPAVRLFFDRARDAGATPEEDAESMETVAEICRHLDGLPLAIELAAAWTPILSPAALLSRLGSRRLSLDHASRDMPERQRTMRDTVAWSHDLLTAAEQAIFRRLAVFTGGCSLDGADVICRGMGEVETDTLMGLVALAEKSLLAVQEQAGDAREPRFSMLETIAQFARERLLEADEAEAACREHAAYFLDMAHEAGPALSGPQQATWLDRLEREHDNFRAALRRAHETGDIAFGLELAAALWPFWRANSHLTEAQRWFDSFLQRAESMRVSPAIRARALDAAGDLAGIRGDTALSISLLRQALAHARRAGDDMRIADTLLHLRVMDDGRMHFRRMDDLLQECLEMYRRADDRVGMCTTLKHMAAAARFRGDYDLAVSRFHEALALCRELGDDRMVARVLANIGSLETERGRPHLSGLWYEEAHAQRQGLGDKTGIADILLRWAETALVMGEFARTTALCEEVIALMTGLGNDYAVAYARLYLAEAVRYTGNLDQAESIAQQTLDAFRAIGDRRCAAEALISLGDIARARGRFEQATALYKEGLAVHWAMYALPCIARCFERMALLAHSQGDLERAARLGGAAAALRLAMGSEIAPVDRAEYEAGMATVRHQMGDAAFAASHAAGRTMAFEQAVSYALESSARRKVRSMSSS